MVNKAIMAYHNKHIDKNKNLEANEQERGEWWLSISTGLFLAILAVVLWWALEKQEDANRHNSIIAENQRVLDIIEIDIRNVILSLQRMVNRWEIRGGTPEKEFISDAKAYITDNPGYQALEWVDKSFHVRWIVPLSGNEAALGFDIAFDNKQRIALESSRDNRSPAISDPINLVQGGERGFTAHFPIYVQGTFDGFILAVFNTKKWMAHLIGVSEETQGEANNFLSLVSIDGEEIFRVAGWDDSKETKWDTISSATIFGHLFTVQNRPTNEFIKRSHSMLPRFVFTGGIFLSFLISMIVYLLQKTARAVKTALAGKDALEKEVTVRKMIELSLIEERQRLAYILEGTNAGTWEWNVQTGEIIFNERWAQIIGYTLEELQPISIDTWIKFVNPDDLEISSNLLEKHFNGELDYYECEARMQHKNGSWVWVLDRGRVSTWTDDGKPLLMSGTHQEITQRKISEEKIRYLANHDALTDLPTLRMARDRIHISIEMAKRNKTMSAILFIDLDGFKSVNDNYGHDAGDAVLKTVAKRLLSCVRKADTVARIGGDEFIIVLTEINSSQSAALVAEKALELVADTIPFNGFQLRVEASIGIALYPGNGDEVETLIKKADCAMYEIKNSGKNGYAFADTRR
ncbi:MAG: diguanylate cyclase [Desulfamplus sp.]|nr:diguanylate cyclase [Desulfamplus sp.]